MYKKMLEDLRKEVETPVDPVLPIRKKGLVSQRQEEPEAPPTDPLSLMREWSHRIKASSSKFQQQAAERRLASKESTPSPQVIVQEVVKDKGLVKRPSAFDGDISSTDEDFSLDVSDAATLLRHKEGFRDKPYWDVNAYRIGYGSDTVTKEDGSVVRVTPNISISRQDAERDLKRRIGEFASKASSKVGERNWETLPEKAKTALISVTYNYGHLPDTVAEAVREGSLGGIAAAVEALASHNEGINKKRRLHEASLIRASM